jgi:uncharacterized glyoxalase superfamily protein PhnB
MRGPYPCLHYPDAEAAIAWLERCLGATRHAVHKAPDGSIAHAELRLGNGLIMLGTAKPDSAAPLDRAMASPQVTYWSVAEVDALVARAASEGAEVLMPPFDTEYGSRDAVLRDPGGHLWCLGSYDPEAATA